MRYWPINAMGQSSGTQIQPIGNVNWEMLAECTQPVILNAPADNTAPSPTKFFRLDATYMLHVTHFNLVNGTAQRLPNQGMRKVILTILNKTTGANKCIGCLYLTGSSTWGVGAAASSNLQGNVIGARLTSGVLDLWIAQATYYTGVSTDMFGLFKKTLTLNLDF